MTTPPLTQTPPGPPSRGDTLAAMCLRSGRDFVPVRKGFVQAPRETTDGVRHGPLASFVNAGDARALQAELLVLTCASAEPYDVAHPAVVWSRALGIETKDPSSALSKVWRRLEDRSLIARERVGRIASITPLREDGADDPYDRPDGRTAADRFFKLAHAFWLDAWYDRLSLPGIAMLLVSLNEKSPFRLPLERVPDWYGFSVDSAQAGMQELVKYGLISYDTGYRREPLSPLGYVEERHYTVLSPFAQVGAS